MSLFTSFGIFNYFKCWQNEYSTHLIFISPHVATFRNNDTLSVLQGSSLGLKCKHLISHMLMRDLKKKSVTIIELQTHDTVKRHSASN